MTTLLQACDGERGAAADKDAGQQVQGGRYGEHQEHGRERGQGEAGLHCREGHLQNELNPDHVHYDFKNCK